MRNWFALHPWVTPPFPANQPCKPTGFLQTNRANQPVSCKPTVQTNRFPANQPCKPTGFLQTNRANQPVSCKPTVQTNMQINVQTNCGRGSNIGSPSLLGYRPGE